MNAPSWIGKSLGGRYQIEQMLGQGGMSAVYKANDPNLRRVVAVKLIHSHLSADPRFLHRFEEEAAAVAQLRHPNIVQVYDFDQDDGIYYMVMEFIPGETLQDRLRRLNRANRFTPLAKAVQYTMDICAAIGYAHKRGMIHRDIKPANIMIDVHDQAILMDFGIVKMVGAEKFTATGAVVGTALYMPPEVIRGEVPDARSDIYSLGVTLYEALSGRPPFEADSAMTLMMMHLNDPLPDLTSQRAEVPPALMSVVERALAKERSARFSSAEEMGQALRALLPELAALQPGGTSVERQQKTPAPQTAAAAAPATEVEPPTTAAPAARPTPAPASVPAVQPQAVGAASSAAPQGAPTLAPAGRQKQETPVSPRPPTAAPAVSSPLPTGINLRSPIVIAAAAGLLIVIVILSVLLLNGLSAARLSGSGSTPTAELAAADINSTQPAQAVAAAATPAPTETSPPPPTPTNPPPSNTPPPTNTPEPTSTPTITPTPTPDLFVVINNITIENDVYVVEYETFGYTEALPGRHVHFFFNTVLPENAGSPGSGPWELYGGPRPFKGYRVSDRPSQATQMCALVANANHSIIPNSGTCKDLP